MIFNNDRWKQEGKFLYYLDEEGNPLFYLEVCLRENCLLPKDMIIKSFVEQYLKPTLYIVTYSHRHGQGAHITRSEENLVGYYAGEDMLIVADKVGLGGVVEPDMDEYIEIETAMEM